MAGQIPREFIDLLLAKIDIVHLIGTRFSLQKSGNNYFARCPFHQEKSPSFSVSQTKQFYHCFGCPAHGNAIDFMMEYEHLTFPEAIETLAREAGMVVPTAPTTSNPQHHLLQQLFDINASASQYYYQQLKHSTRAIEYLKQRGITGETAQMFRIGYAPSAWQALSHHLEQQQISKEKLSLAGLCVHKNEGSYYDRFRDRLMFPIHNHRGRVIGFGGRIIDQGEPKYLNSPETPTFQKGHELYGLYQTLKHHQLSRILIVEGYMDVISLFQHGITYAVATLGTATTAHHIHRLLRYTSQLVFCFDGDTAGRTAAWRALQIMLPLMRDDIQIRFLFLPDNEDPDTFVQQQKKEGFEAHLDQAMALSAFFFQHLAQQFDIGTLEGRAQLASKAMEMIKTIPPSLFQQLVIQELAKKTRLEIHQLQPAATAKLTAPMPTAPKPALSTEKLAAPLRLIIALLLQQPHLIHALPLPLEAIPIPGDELLQALIQHLMTNPHQTTALLLEQWRGQAVEPLLRQLARWQHFIPEDKMLTAMEQGLAQRQALSIDNEINKLLTKSQFSTLNQDEKNQLASLDR